MNWMRELAKTESVQNAFTVFLNQYGLSGLEKAMHLYSGMQEEYICRSKTEISKFRVADIYYLDIKTHTITIHTRHGIYQKYGSLTEEEKRLSPYGFIKCNQSCIVNLGKIRSIRNNDITLINHVRLHMSQHYTPRVLIAFSQYPLSEINDQAV